MCSDATRFITASMISNTSDDSSHGMLASTDIVPLVDSDVCMLSISFFDFLAVVEFLWAIILTSILLLELCNHDKAFSLRVMGVRCSKYTDPLRLGSTSVG